MGCRGQSHLPASNTTCRQVTTEGRDRAPLFLPYSGESSSFAPFTRWLTRGRQERPQTGAGGRHLDALRQHLAQVGEPATWRENDVDQEEAGNVFTVTPTLDGLCHKIQVAVVDSQPCPGNGARTTFSSQCVTTTTGCTP
jgi:hypothetical protein